MDVCFSAIHDRYVPRVYKIDEYQHDILSLDQEYVLLQVVPQIQCVQLYDCGKYIPKLQA
jgi:hypothetical protein